MRLYRGFSGPWLAALIIVLASSADAQDARTGSAVVVESAQISFSLSQAEDERFGKLAWRGGIVVNARNDARFGGLSGLAIARDGRRMVAVSDRAYWVTGALTYSDGMLSAIGDVRLGVMLGPDGREFPESDLRDAESVAADGPEGLDGPMLVGFERGERLARYDFASAGMAAKAEYLPLPPAVAKGPNNRELEAIRRAPAGGPLEGAIIIVSERFLDQDGNIRGWIVDGGSSQSFAVRRSDDYDVTDIDFLPDGDLIVLERRFSLLTGPGMRMRRIEAAALKPGATIDGEVLIDAGASFSIDNMEGLAIHRDAGSGEVRLTVISDDNYNALQRTLILQFALAE